MRQKAAGERNAGVGKGQGQDFYAVHIQRRGAHHGFVIAGGADAQAVMGFEKPDQNAEDERAKQDGHEGVHPVFAQQAKQRAVEQRFGRDERDVGAGIHDEQVDGIQPAHCENAGENGVHAHFGLQKPGNGAGQGPGQGAGQQAQERMACDRTHGGHRQAQGKAAVGGEVRNVENAEADIHAQGQQAVEEAELQRAQH